MSCSLTLLRSFPGPSPLCRCTPCWWSRYHSGPVHSWMWVGLTIKVNSIPRIRDTVHIKMCKVTEKQNCYFPLYYFIIIVFYFVQYNKCSYIHFRLRQQRQRERRLLLTRHSIMETMLFFTTLVKPTLGTCYSTITHTVAVEAQGPLVNVTTLNREKTVWRKKQKCDHTQYYVQGYSKKTLVVSRFPFLCELSFNDVVFHLSAAFSKCRLEEDERARPPPAWEREKIKRRWLQFWRRTQLF